MSLCVGGSRAYLWDQPVRHREADNPRDKSGAAEEEEVPMEAPRLPEGELAGLGRNATDVLTDAVSVRSSAP